MMSAKLLADGLSFPEGPVFDGLGRLWFVEIHGGNLCRYEDGEVRRWPTGGAPNGLTVDTQDRIWLCDSGHMAVMRFDPATETFATICDRVDGHALDKPNDLAFDAAGNLVFTCPGDSRTEPTGYVCARLPDGAVKTLKDDLYFPNGLAFTADGSELIVAETYRQRLWKGGWDSATASWIEPRVWATGLDGAPGPDGFAFATDGTLYVAVFGPGHIFRLAGQGQIIERLPLPGLRPTNCAFDPSGRLGLVVTEAERGELLSLSIPNQGQPLFVPPEELP